MARFDRQIETALRLIAKNGELVTWRAINDPTPTDPNDLAPTDPNRPWLPGAATLTDHDVIICFLPATSSNLRTYGSFSFMNKTEVPSGLVIGLMGQVDFEPNLKDVVIRNGRELRIVDFDVLDPNGQKILYTVTFQK